MQNIKEYSRLLESRQQESTWKKWGPYLSERQWGTVREDYSENGDAWEYFSHDQARSRAYRWGEDVFDIFVEYAKAAPEDILVRITMHNRGPAAARLHLLPTLWFRNTWSHAHQNARPLLRSGFLGKSRTIVVEHGNGSSQERLQVYTLSGEVDPALLFCDNETNRKRLFGIAITSAYVKGSINDFIVTGDQSAINPEQTSTKASFYYPLDIEAGSSAVVRLRLSAAELQWKEAMTLSAADDLFDDRQREADEFYRHVTPSSVGEDDRAIMRQELAGMLWTKQYYHFDADLWLEEHHAHPLHSQSRPIRNKKYLASGKRLEIRSKLFAGEYRKCRGGFFQPSKEQVCL
ncbi:hypothetical protein [Desulfopila inferna]|uniref:hypothetical protein n=1 Tax=Desulfopila inferna TaxID=468528 RepID=UPI0019623825|nr:hypothetical protein [Desulfopila inferna]MBM9604347.1 hypothetical protein [Desulfopila inferna]